MNHNEYITARSRNIITLQRLGITDSKISLMFPRLEYASSPLDYRAQLCFMSDTIDSIKGRSNKRGKQYTYTTR